MENEVSFLEDIIIPQRKKSKQYNLITVFGLLFLLYFILLFTFGNQITRSSSQTMPFIVIMMLPVLGLLFHITGRKTGWILNTIFYTLIISIVSANIISNIIMAEKLETYMAFNWRSLVPFLLTLTLVILLLSKTVRRYFNVSSLLLVICLGIPIALGLIYFFTLLNRIE